MSNTNNLEEVKQLLEDKIFKKLKDKCDIDENNDILTSIEYYKLIDAFKTTFKNENDKKDIESLKNRIQFLIDLTKKCNIDIMNNDEFPTLTLTTLETNFVKNNVEQKVDKNDQQLDNFINITTQNNKSSDKNKNKETKVNPLYLYKRIVNGYNFFKKINGNINGNINEYDYKLFRRELIVVCYEIFDLQTKLQRILIAPNETSKYKTEIGDTFIKLNDKTMFIKKLFSYFYTDNDDVLNQSRYKKIQQIITEGNTKQSNFKTIIAEIIEFIDFKNFIENSIIKLLKSNITNLDLNKEEISKKIIEYTAKGYKKYLNSKDILLYEYLIKLMLINIEKFEQIYDNSDFKQIVTDLTENNFEEKIEQIKKLEFLNNIIAENTNKSKNNFNENNKKIGDEITELRKETQSNGTSMLESSMINNRQPKDIAINTMKILKNYRGYGLPFEYISTKQNKNTANDGKIMKSINDQLNSEFQQNIKRLLEVNTKLNDDTLQKLKDITSEIAKLITKDSSPSLDIWATNHVIFLDGLINFLSKEDNDRKTINKLKEIHQLQNTITHYNSIEDFLNKTSSQRIDIDPSKFEPEQEKISQYIEDNKVFKQEPNSELSQKRLSTAIQPLTVLRPSSASTSNTQSAKPSSVLASASNRRQTTIPPVNSYRTLGKPKQVIVGPKKQEKGGKVKMNKTKNQKNKIKKQTKTKSKIKIQNTKKNKTKKHNIKRNKTIKKRR